MTKIPSPCIGICSTALGDSVCKGCKRKDVEVDGWNGFTEERKKTIDERIDNDLTNTMKSFFRIVDQNALIAALLSVRGKVKVSYHRSLYSQMYDLCRAYKDTLDTQRVGIEVLRGFTVSEALNAVDVQWHQNATFRYDLD